MGSADIGVDLAGTQTGQRLSTGLDRVVGRDGGDHKVGEGCNFGIRSHAIDMGGGRPAQHRFFECAPELYVIGDDAAVKSVVAQSCGDGTARFTEADKSDGHERTSLSIV